MNREAFDHLMKIAIQQGEADYLWKQLYANRSVWADSSGLFDDPKFISEVERFMHGNRRSMTTGERRVVLRQMINKLGAMLVEKRSKKPNSKSVTEFMSRPVTANS